MQPIKSSNPDCSDGHQSFGGGEDVAFCVIGEGFFACAGTAPFCEQSESVAGVCDGVAIGVGVNFGKTWQVNNRRRARSVLQGHIDGVKRGGEESRLSGA